MLRFSGFELDQQRSELRGPDGQIIKLRAKAFDLLRLLATNPGRIMGKHELMTAVWPNVHVSEDSLFQCIREIRAALGDDKRQLIRAVSGRGYLFEAEVSGTTDAGMRADAAPAASPETESKPAGSQHGFSMPRRAALVAMAGLGVSAVAAALWLPRLFTGSPVTVAVMPMAVASGEPQAARMAADVTRDLTDGLAKIEAIRAVVPSSAAQGADYVVSSELEKTETAWNLRARMTEPATGAVKWTTSLSVHLTDADARLERTRLTAGMGHALALRINELQSGGKRIADGVRTGTARIAIEQATASIDQTTLERFRAAQTILEKALTEDADNVDLQVALAGFQLRGVQMAWFPPPRARGGRKQRRGAHGARVACAARLHPGAGNTLPVSVGDQPVHRESGRVRQGARP